MTDHENAIRVRRHLVAAAVAMHDAKQAAIHVESLARAVAREEIERALPGRVAPTEPGMAGTRGNPRPAVAPVSGQPGGVRVVLNWDPVHDPEVQRVEVDRETLIDALDAYEEVLTRRGYNANRAEAREALCTRLGLTLSDGGTDEVR